MRCPFCQSSNTVDSRLCLVCGGPLRGLNRTPIPGDSRPQPISPIPAPEAAISPTKPQLVAQKLRDKSAPRVVAALFWEVETDFYPLLVLESGELQVWDLARDEMRVFPARRTLRRLDVVTVAAFAPESATFITGHASGQLRFQRLEARGALAACKCHFLGVIEAHRGQLLSLAVAQNRLYSAGSDGAVILTALSDALTVQSPPDWESKLILESLGGLTALAVSLDNRLLALGADDGQVQMWRLAADGTPDRLDWTSQKDASKVESLSFSPNGNMLLSCNARHQLCLWAAQTGHRLQQIAPAVFPSFAPDNRLLAHANAANTIALCDAWTGTRQNTLPPLPGGVQALSFSPTANGSAATLLIGAGAQQNVAWKVDL